MTGAGLADIARDPELPPFHLRYALRYPLREWGLDRNACGRVIVNAGLPLPPKSACFFCPAMKEAEIHELRTADPVSFALALEMERRYRAGRHFRGDGCFTVKAVHKETGERVEMQLFGASERAVVAQFRQRHGDTKRPFRYKARASMAVPGLGRSFAWTKMELPMIQPTLFEE